jgi:hypothetical protein
MCYVLCAPEVPQIDLIAPLTFWWLTISADGGFET